MEKGEVDVNSVAAAARTRHVRGTRVVMLSKSNIFGILDARDRITAAAELSQRMKSVNLVPLRTSTSSQNVPIQRDIPITPQQ